MAKSLKDQLAERDETIAALEAQIASAQQGAEGPPAVPELEPGKTYPLDTTIGVAVAIARVMADMPSIGKTGQAPAGMGGFNFRKIEDITSVAQKLMAKHGVVVVPRAQTPTFDAWETTADNGKVTRWSDTRVLYEYTVMGPDGSSVPAATFGLGRDNFDKGAGKAATTAYKILLLQLFVIGDANADIDAHDASGSNNSNSGDTNGRTFGTGQAPDEPKALIDWHGLGWTENPIPNNAEGTKIAKDARATHDKMMKAVADELAKHLDEDAIKLLVEDRKKVIGSLPFSTAQVRTWEGMADAAIREIKGDEPDVDGAMQDAFPGSTEDERVYGDAEPEASV